MIHINTDGISKKEMIKEIIEKLDLKEEKRMYFPNGRDYFLENCHKCCIKALWEKIVEND
jgi:hypothetical protein